ncbi:MAG TPA: oxygen-dependent coproporphyrinogen oxidase [Bordetella sp.]|nr:oxygen-dependent coproporphyrinogen oxidase [Bordetella sp.]
MTPNTPTFPLPIESSIEMASVYFSGLQARIVAALEQLEGTAFHTDTWKRPEGGGGVSRLLEGGQVLERAAVLLSHVTGKSLPPSASARRPELAGRPWQAMGVSLVLHPRNPYVPTVHMNVRLFFSPARHGGDVPAFWFGGGMDLTPYYAFEEDARHFHRACRDALDPHDQEYYPRFKKWCDEYFYLKHRAETRGIGGIFFDDLDSPGFGACFALVRDVGNAFPRAYMPIIEHRRNERYGKREREFQAYRRGRYVEFNLVYDRGTLFGLQSGGRAESILLSMPPAANWRYDWKSAPGTPEAALASFLVPRDWI